MICCACGWPQDGEACEAAEEEDKEHDECLDDEGMESESKEDVEKGTFKDCSIVKKFLVCSVSLSCQDEKPLSAHVPKLPKRIQEAAEAQLRVSMTEGPTEAIKAIRCS